MSTEQQNSIENANIHGIELVMSDLPEVSAPNTTPLKNQLSRRQFLKGVVGAAGVAAVGHLAPDKKVLASPEGQETLLPDSIQVALLSGQTQTLSPESISDPYFSPVKQSLEQAIRDTNSFFTERGNTTNYSIVIPGVKNNSTEDGSLAITPTPPQQQNLTPVYVSTEQWGLFYTPDIGRPTIPESAWSRFESSNGDFLQAINALDDSFNYRVDPTRISQLYVVPFPMGANQKGALALIDRNTSELYAQGFIDSYNNPTINWQRVLKYDENSNEFVRTLDNRINYLSESELSEMGMTQGIRFTTNSGRNVQITTNVPGFSLVDINVDKFDGSVRKATGGLDLATINIEILHNPNGDPTPDSVGYTGQRRADYQNPVRNDAGVIDTFRVYISNEFFQHNNHMYEYPDGAKRSMLNNATDELILASLATTNPQTPVWDQYQRGFVTVDNKKEIYEFPDMTISAYIPPQN